MLTLNDITTMVSNATQLGMMQAIKAYEPTNDMVRLSEIKLWLSLNNISEKQFKKLEHAGLIRRFKVGSGKNSPLVYSKAEIQQAICSQMVCSWIANNNVNSNQNER